MDGKEVFKFAVSKVPEVIMEVLETAGKTKEEIRFYMPVSYTHLPTVSVKPAPTVSVAPTPTASAEPAPTVSVKPAPTASAKTTPTASVAPIPTVSVAPIPVSDTHLDVYKRQVQPSWYWNIDSALYYTIFYCIGSVSYTHLEVYKRQGLFMVTLHQLLFWMKKHRKISVKC